METKNKAEILKYNNGKRKVAEMLDGYQMEIAKALPTHLTPEIMMRAALTAAVKNPKLMLCTEHSFLAAVLTISQLGLIPDNILGQCFLIPFKNNKKEVMEVQVIIGYKGLNELAWRTGRVKSLTVNAVYEGDEFDYDLGLDQKLTYKPLASKDPNKLTHVYAIIEFINGGKNFAVMTRAQVEETRNNSPNWKYADDKKLTIWFNHFVAMALKTVLRQLLKYVPMSTELSKAIALDELAEVGERQNLAAGFLDEFKEEKYNDAIVTDIIDDEAELKDKILQQQRNAAAEKGNSSTAATEKLIKKKVPKKSI